MPRRKQKGRDVWKGEPKKGRHKGEAALRAELRSSRAGTGEASAVRGYGLSAAVVNGKGAA